MKENIDYGKADWTRRFFGVESWEVHFDNRLVSVVLGHGVWFVNRSRPFGILHRAKIETGGNGWITAPLDVVLPDLSHPIWAVFRGVMAGEAPEAFLDILVEYYTQFEPVVTEVLGL